MLEFFIFFEKSNKRRQPKKFFHGSVAQRPMLQLFANLEKNGSYIQLPDCKSRRAERVRSQRLINRPNVAEPRPIRGQCCGHLPISRRAGQITPIGAKYWQIWLPQKFSSPSGTKYFFMVELAQSQVDGYGDPQTELCSA